jgi:carbohydrate diacid regulator
MIRNARLQEVIREIREITKNELAVFDEKGRLLASTFTPPQKITKEILPFIGSRASSRALSGFLCFRVGEEEETEYVLLITDDKDESHMVGRLAVSQIRNLSAAYHEQTDRNTFMQNVLLGNFLAVDLYQRAEKLKIRDSRWLCFVIEAEGRKDPSLMTTLRTLANKSTDFVTETEERSAVLVKDVKAFKGPEDMEDYARTIVDTLLAEVMVKVRVGYGNPAESLEEIARSFQEAELSLAVGKIFYASQETISYQHLGIGRLIYQLPESLCVMFIKEVFGDREIEIDEETYAAVEKFFENSLNIAETARQLYVHRNTLVYRLDRFQKEVGLDVRNFEDAISFKIAMMVRAQLKHIRDKKE